jgi:phosphoglycolate phosphatase
VLGVQHHETLFVGDSEVDMDTATNAKLTSVGVTWGFRSEELLRKHQANYISHQPLELLEIMDEVNLK